MKILTKVVKVRVNLNTVSSCSGSISAIFSQMERRAKLVIDDINKGQINDMTKWYLEEILKGAKEGTAIDARMFELYLKETCPNVAR